MCHSVSSIGREINLRGPRFLEATVSIVKYDHLQVNLIDRFCEIIEIHEIHDGDLVKGEEKGSVQNFRREYHL